MKNVCLFTMKSNQSALRGILAANLKNHRKMLGLSQEKLAEMTNLSWQTINSIECHRTWVSDKTLESLADALKIDSYQLLLPIEDAIQKPIDSNEAIKRLVKIKRTFDDLFNDIVNLTR